MSAAIPFYQHDLGAEELQSLARALAGPILTTGPAVAEFERRFADYLGRRHAIGLTSCTGALHLSLTALGVGPGDEVITTPLTFVATATAVMQAGATPVLVDVEPDTGNIDAARVEAAITPRTRAILPVHLYGQMCDMRRLDEVARRHGLHFVEDAAHCVEGERDGVRPGQMSRAACFSFYATKNLTCGEGGAVVTDDDGLAERLRLLRSHGMNKTAADRVREGYRHWDMVTFGWKYNMDNLQAALLLPQMDRLEANGRRRRALAEHYERRLAGVSGVTPVRCLPGVRHARHLFPVRVGGGRRDRVVDGLQAAGIGVVVNYRPIHLLTFFRERFGFREGDYPVAERIGREVLSLPFYPALSHADADRVVATLAGLLRQGAAAA
ncbi:MAG TPA: DegT/DnrJ/EryC1/StrS family aminotransferase [Gemmataceae bacterium]|nr:DegT/DnrJ/EryC1/StrS family aminotransferase [Gemmataceae bacterium]